MATPLTCVFYSQACTIVFVCGFYSQVEQQSEGRDEHEALEGGVEVDDAEENEQTTQNVEPVEPVALTTKTHFVVVTCKSSRVKWNLLAPDRGKVTIFKYSKTPDSISGFLQQDST